MIDEKTFTQYGRNSKYPKEIKVWRLGDESIPTWLSDIAKVKFGENGELVLDYRELSSGGYSILDSSGKYTLISVQYKSSYVCLGDSILFSITENQFKLLYKEKKNKIKE